MVAADDEHVSASGAPNRGASDRLSMRSNEAAAGAGSARAPNEPIDPVQQLGKFIEQALQSLLELGICASDVQPSALEIAEPGLPASGHPAGLVGRKVVATIDRLNEVYATSEREEAVRNRMIPLEVVKMIDQGKNPDKYTRDFVERTAGENMFTNGIIKSLNAYEGHLKELIGEAFPDLKDMLDER